MAVRNGQPFLDVAIESILNQTYAQFDFLIVDDSSTDNTCKIIKSYDDPRIKLISLSENVGQTAALNVGIRQISTPWIARMDADDYSEHTRLEKQIKASETNPSVCCIGTNCWVFRDDPNIIEEIIKKPENDAEIKSSMLKEPSIIHGSILIKLEALLDAGGFNERFRVSADIDLYERLLTPSRYAMNIPEPLLGFRRHQHQETKSLRAIEEGIEIFNRRLISDRYSKNDKKVIRSTLALFHLLRSRYHLRKFHINKGVWIDIFHAFLISPLSIFNHSYKTLIYFFKKLKH